MGSSSSEPKEVVIYVESDESKRIKALFELEKQLIDLKKRSFQSVTINLNDT
jgi:hypothetical protein